MATSRNQVVLIRLRGRLEELRNSVTNSSGKIPWTASPVPKRSASSAPRPANPNAIRIDSASSTSAPPTPLAIADAGGEPDEQVDDRLHDADTNAPPSWPTSSASPRSGVSARRLKKPDSMSRARSMPAVIDTNIAPWMNGMASRKSR